MFRSPKLLILYPLLFSLHLVPFFSKGIGLPIKGDSLHRERFCGVLTGKAVLTGGSYLMLEEVWYSQYPRGRFHFFDDSRQWLQMDKAGHFWAGYHLSRWSHGLWKWSGMGERSSRSWGGGVGFFVLSGIEVMDGFSKGWGFSVSDAGSNLLGVTSFLIQKRAWGEAYITPAYSYGPSPYPKHRPELLGANGWERLLKDYNGQSYWLDLHPELFGSPKPWPDWLALSFGYGASGMLGGQRNPEKNAAGESLPSFPRYRRYFLSLDLLTDELPIEGKGWKLLFNVLDGIKLPFPLLEYNRVEGVKGHWLTP